jgi:hypothetical protein
MHPCLKHRKKYLSIWKLKQTTNEATRQRAYKIEARSEG